MRPLRPLAALATVALLGACGTGTGTTGTGTGTTGTGTGTTGTGTGTTGSSTSVPTTSGARVRLVTVTGSVSDGVEAGCLLLTPTPTDTNGPWLLVGRVASITAGQQVTVRGYRVEDRASTCQQGRPFQVEAVLTN